MFIKNYKDFLFEVRDKKHEPAGEKADKDHKEGNHAGKDEELEKEINDELTDVAEDCPRCGGACQLLSMCREGPLVNTSLSQSSKRKRI